MSRTQGVTGSGVWLVLTAAMLWGTTGTTQSFAPEGATPLSVGGIRVAVGGVALLLLALQRGGRRSTGRLKLGPLLVGALLMAVYQVSFFSGVAWTGVAVGTVVGIGSAPIFAGFISLVVDRQRPSVRWAVATALAVSGCVLLVTAGSTIRVNLLGIGLACLAGFSYAIYTFVMVRVLKHQSLEVSNAVVFCGAALLLSPLLARGDLSWLASTRGLAVALWLGIVATALAYVLYGRALYTVPSHQAVTLALMEPVTAAFLGIVVLGERLTPAATAGMGLVMAGLAIITLGRNVRSWSRERISQAGANKQ